MSFDGIFINHLLKEISSEIKGQRINKLIILSETDFVFQFPRKKQLYITINGNNPHIRMSKSDYINTLKTNSLIQALKKHFESGIVIDIKQIRNDRIIVIEVLSHDDLGYEYKTKLVLEMFGRNANLIIISEEDIILECYKKTPLLTDDNSRVLITKIKFEYIQSDKINPWKIDYLPNQNIFEGVSNVLFTEMQYQNSKDIINNKIEPLLIKSSNNKIYYYVFDLKHLEGERTYFDSISELLEYYYTVLKKISVQNNEQKIVEHHISKEINKNKLKLTKQIEDKKDAINNLQYEKIGNLLSSNLYKIDNNSSYIIVNDFYENNQEIKIELDPSLSPTRNLEIIFNKYKKAKRAIEFIEDQIEITKNDIIYYECLLDQLNLSKNLDLKEIIEELNINIKLPQKRKNSKPNITIYNDFSDNTIYVGKNNNQNNYLTHSFANKSDYFFHVKNIPGSHTILRTNNLTDDLIKLTATIAAIHSKGKYSSNVAVDYTQIKNVKKVPKMKGPFVTYTNYKTVYVNPDVEFVEKNTKN